MQNETGRHETAAAPAKRKRGAWKGPFKHHREGGWALYFWHGMRIRTWWRLLARARFAITVNCLPQILTVTLLTPGNSLMYRISELVHGRRAERHEPEPPIFVIGHWRTGTTFLHELLARDPAHGYPTTFQCFFPSHFMLSSRYVRRWFNLLLPKKRPIDNVAIGVDSPQEDEFALLNLGAGSPYLTLAIPRGGPADMEYLDLHDLTDRQRHEWEQTFLWFIRRLSYYQRKRLVLKSPTHTARIRTLIKLFPDARFVYTHRDPLALYPSMMRTWKALNSVQGLHNPARDDPWLEEFVLSNFEILHARYEEERGLIPPGHLIEIAYDELIADPKGTVKKIYRELDLGDFARAEPALDAYLEGVRDFKTGVNVLADDKRALIARRWAAYFDRFGYARS